MRPATQPPEVDLRRITVFCADYWPEEFHHDVRGEFHARGRNVTLCETRAPWDGQGDWTHLPIAQLRYRAESADWSLHWADRNSRWHPYDPDGVPVTGSCVALLAEIDRDPTGIFKG